MAQKYRCPVCGATHKELQDQCRLCGQALGPEAAVGTPQANYSSVEGSRGIGGIVGVVVLLVVAVVAVAVLLGAVPGIKKVDEIKNRAGIGGSADGWNQFEYPAGGFSVLFPSGDRKTQTKDDGYYAYTLIGKDTMLVVGAKRVLTEAEFDKITQSTDGLNELKKETTAAVDQIEKDAKAQGVKIDKRTETAAYGVPAVYLEKRDVKPPFSGLRTDAILYSRAIYFIKGGVLYSVEAISVYREAEQYDRLLEGLQITGPPGSSAGTTAVP